MGAFVTEAPARRTADAPTSTRHDHSIAFEVTHDFSFIWFAASRLDQSAKALLAT